MFDHYKKIDAWVTVWILTFLSFGLTVYDLFFSIWSKDDQAYGPILFVLSLWLLYAKRFQFHLASASKYRTFSYILVLIVALICNIIGGSQQLIQLQAISLPITLVASIFLLGGAQQLKVYIAPIIFMFLMVPLPASMVDVITQPMKVSVSWAAENVLFWLDYPIARQGVILQVGQYKLLVADACSGLKSLFSLEAFGIAYLSLVRSNSIIRNVILGLCIIPISFISNTIRIVILALLTYHEGEAVAQGFLHQFSGIVLFAVAILITVTVDKAVQYISKSSTVIVHSNGRTPNKYSSDFKTFNVVFFSVALFAISSCGITILKPQIVVDDNFKLSDFAPNQISEWHLAEADMKFVDVNFNSKNEKSYYYDKAISKIYTNGKQQVMLALAYTNQLSQDIKIHQQEICYAAQGFKIVSKNTETVDINGKKYQLVHILTKRQDRIELATYFIRIGNRTDLSASALNMRFYMLEEGLFHHLVLDGLLVRVSQIIQESTESQAAITTNKEFIRKFINNQHPNSVVVTGQQ